MSKHALLRLCTQCAYTIKCILVQNLRSTVYNCTIVLVHCVIPVDCSVLIIKRISFNVFTTDSSKAYII